MATLVKISINEEIARVLERLKGEYPTLSAPELFKLGLAELDRKRELEARKHWAESLPTLEISEVEAKSIAEAREEKGRIMTPSELIAGALGETADATGLKTKRRKAK